MGETSSWAVDVIEQQLRQVGETLATLERLRGALVSTGDAMVWRSRAADHFSHRVGVSVASVDGLVLALCELEQGMRRTRAQLLRAAPAGG